MKHPQKRILLFIISTLVVLVANAQKYPVSVNSTLFSPYPIYKEDLTNLTSNNWSATVTFNDFSEPNREVYLNLSITSDLLNITTNAQSPALPTFTIFPGVPLQINAAQLADYLRPTNITIRGANGAQFKRTNRFPEGIHDFCIEVIDKFSGEILSRKSCNSIWIQLNDQPMINAPQCGQVIDPEIAMNTFFQWQQLGNLSPNSIASTEYQFTLYEITGNGTLSPQSAISNGQVIRHYQSDWLNNTTLIYDISYPALTKGKRYAWQVQARDRNGRDIFKNNGFSEVCWFSYGYPENGHINIEYPENNTGFAKNDLQYFDWSGPDNMLDNQHVEYQVYIKEMEEGQTAEDAYTYNAIWHTYRSERLYQNQGFDLTIDKSIKKLESGKTYCWKVEAYTGDQKIAESDISTFVGPPFLESFYVDLYEIEVTKLYNNDVNNLSGEGRLIITEDKQKANITFHNIGLENIAGRYYLEKGVVESELDPVLSVPLNAKDAINKPCVANINAIRLSKLHGFMAKAIIDWDFYLPTADGADISVTFNNVWFIYDFYQLSGYANPDKDYTYNLMEPLGFQFHLSEESSFIIRENVYDAFFEGKVRMPKNVDDQEKNDVYYTFYDQKQIYYMQEQNQVQTKTMAYDGLNVTLQPTNYTFDFSDAKSPYHFADDPYWKGFFFNTYDFTLETQLGYQTTLNFGTAIKKQKEQTANGNNNCWINHEGLYFKIENQSFEEENEGVTFNTFPSNLYDFSLLVEQSEFTSGDLHGGIKIPVISDTKEFPFEVPFNYLGFTDGYLTEELEGQTFTFNPEGEEQKMLIDIKRAVFRDKNHLEMSLNLDWPYFKVKMEQLDQFCVWGNYDIGFKVPNGITSLQKQVRGKASEYDITMEYIGAGRTANLYSIGNKATIVMGEDVAGDKGPPTINAYSIVKSTTIPENYIASYTPDFEIENINDPDLFTPFNSGSGMEVEDEYQQDLQKLLYEFDQRLGQEDTLVKDSVPEFENKVTADSLESQTVNVTEIMESLNMLIELLTFVADEEQKQKLIKVRDLLTSYDNSELAVIIKDIEANGFDINRIIQAQIDKLVNKLNSKIIQKVAIVQGKIKVLVYKPVDLFMNPFNQKVDEMVDRIVDPLVPIVNSNTIALNTLETLRKSTKERVKGEFKDAVYGSVDKNIVNKINSSIDTIITINITNFLTQESKKLGSALLTKDGDRSQVIEQLLASSVNLLEDMGNDLVDDISKVNAASIKRTGENLVNDAYNEISWQVIGDRIKEDIIRSLDETLKKEVVNAVANLFGEGGNGLAGGIASGVLANVDMDFTNLGEKLRNGEIDKIIKYDPTKIVVKSSVAEFEGMLKHKKDSIWGDSWQAMINGKILKPKVFTAQALFINGKVDDYNYWFLELAIKNGLDVPLAPAIVMDGINGKVYHHMKYERETKKYFPYKDTRFGIGVGAFLADGAPGARDLLGKTARLNVGLELAIMEDYFTVEIRGTAGLGFKNKIDQGTDYGKCFVTGDGFIGYNSKENHLLGEFTVTTNTAPLLCAGGTLGLSIKPGYWNVYIGKKESPIYAKLLCKDFAKFEAWFDLSNTRFEAGIKQDVDIYAKSPWFKVLGKQVQPFAGFGYHFLAEIALQIQPKFKLEEAALELGAYAEIGANIKKRGNIKKWVLAGAYLDGAGRYKNTDEEAYISASLSGRIKIIGIGVGVSMNVHKEFAKG